VWAKRGNENQVELGGDQEGGAADSGWDKGTARIMTRNGGSGRYWIEPAEE